MSPTSDQLQPLLDLYHQDYYLQAWHRAQELGPLEQWEGVEGLLFAGSLLGNLGADHQAQRLHTRAYRLDRSHPKARRYYGYHLLTRFGPLVAWRWMRRTDDPLASTCQESEWLNMAGMVAACLRDFEVADQLCARAAALSDDPWLAVERASVREREDRYEEALAEAWRSLEKTRQFRPGVQATARLLTLLGRDSEAEVLLREASENMESYVIDYQLAMLYYEARRWSELMPLLDRVEAHAPLLTPEWHRVLARLRSDGAYFQGDLPAALAYSGEGSEPPDFHVRIAERLREAQEQNTPARSVLLPVGFVRQHHMTCVPATLSTLSRFFARPADHLEIVEEICYDGTPGHRERQWAERNGYVSHEFTLTWEAAVALLDQGLPFTLATVAPGSAHLQAVVGYDLRRRTLFLRDPYHRMIHEALADELIAQQAATGPRAHLLLPQEKSTLLENITLPEATLWDRYYTLQSALFEHRRADAIATAEQLSQAHPEHRLTLMAARSLAHYDGSVSEQLAAVERLLERYPTEPNWQRARLAYLSELARPAEHQAYLETLCDSEQGITFWETKAQELLEDPRHFPEAEKLLRRVLTHRPTSASTLSQLALLRWKQRRFPEAIELYRFAACLDDKNENAAHAYFQALQWRGNAGAALEYLRLRFTRLGTRSSQPAQTLYQALWSVDQHTEAQQILHQALEQRPDDTELMLFAATRLAQQGKFSQAHEWLKEAQNRSSERNWLYAAANVAAAESDHETEQRIATQILEREPLALSAHRVLADAQAHQGGPEAAVAYLKDVTERFPYHLGLGSLEVSWRRESGDPQGALHVLERLRHAHPSDLWVRRERAVIFATELHQPERGLQEIDEAWTIHPNDPYVHSIRGAILQQLGRLSEAQDAWRAALKLNADNTDALTRLVRSGTERSERRAAIAFIIGELIRQPVQGEGIAALQEVSQGSGLPEETLATLRQLHKARPDLWQCWNQLADQLRLLGDYQAAQRVIQEAQEHFPLLPTLYITQAQILQEQGRTQEAVPVLQQALVIRPDSTLAIRQLSEIQLQKGEIDLAIATLESGLRRSPQNRNLMESLAYLLWTVGRGKEALVQLRLVILHFPDSDWAWQSLRTWSLKLGQKDAAIALAREQIARRPQDVTLLLRLAQLLPGEALDERLGLLEQVLVQAPRLLKAHQAKVKLLTQLGRYDDARAACQPAAYLKPPLALQVQATRVMAESGDIEKALREITTLLDREPEHYEGWTLAADWASKTKSYPLYERAALNLTRLAPDQAIGWGYLGDAKRYTKDLPGAKEALRRAYQLSPDYTFAGTTLLKLYVEDNQEEEALQLLKNLLATQPTDLWVGAQGVVALAKLKQFPEACQQLKRLCCQPPLPGQDILRPLQYCQKNLQELQRGDDFSRSLTEALELPDVRPEVAQIRIQELCEKKAWDDAKALTLRLAEHPILGPRALASYAVALADHRKPGAVDFIQTHHGSLSREDRAWGSISHAYFTLGEYQKVVSWTADWQSRQNVEAWMLLNRSSALRYLQRDEESAQVSRAALALPPDYTQSWHALWVAFEDACAGKDTAALLSEYSSGQQDSFFQFLRSLVHILEKAPENAGVLELRRLLVAGVGKPSNRPLSNLERRLVRRTGNIVLRTSPNPLVKLWCLGLWLVGAP